MRILYYDWDEFNGADCRDAMKRLGHEVETLRLDLSGYELTPEIEAEFARRFERMESGKRYFDLVYSFDYFPNISEVCRKYDMPYVSWVFDCPHLTLDSHTLKNSVNHVYVFDKVLYGKLRAKGAATVHYSPLGVNEKRLSALCRELDEETGGRVSYWHDVCFLGSLYDNEYNFYDQISYLPPELKMYLDQVIMLQEKIFGHDLFTDEKAITDAHIDRIKEYVSFEKTGKYEIDYDNVIRDMLRKKVTVNERRNILTRMADNFDTVIYTNPDAKPIKNLNNMGIADYVNKMPVVFHRSKVNLNITLRCITSGVPLRVIDVLAAGGFLITSYTPEVEEYFCDGKDLIIAHTPDEMVQQAAYYLEHEEERKAIALAGQKKVFEKFTYTKLLPEVLKI